ncbi:hypothetical protein BB934_44975 (plasmid) [Microvirga ossetica]|uniref:Uncharacterized protein n=1 Tax=Microvirga ossetica TaxID=1882682 RepID=A0A1B2EZA3_9HYPH|nr:hypothetical protein BB934_44975 [Microvirga ossetica]
MLRIDCAIVLRHSDLGDIVLRDNRFCSSEDIWVAPGTSEQTTQAGSQPSSTQEAVMPCKWSLESPSE